MAPSHVVHSVLPAILLILSFGASPSTSQPGFQLINCGGEAYTDPNTTLSWDADPYIESNNILIHGKVGKVNSSTSVMTTLRSFPNDSKNKKFCYSLETYKGGNYLLRASFLYGNYDGLNQPPTFVLIFNSYVWKNVSTSSSSIPIIHELNFLSDDDGLNICLAPKFNSNQAPFISTLQLILLQTKMYNEYNTNALSNGYGLMLWRRINYGAKTEAEIRYPDDEFDRIWEANTTGPTISTSPSNVVNYADDPEMPPAKVMATAITSSNSTENISLTYENYGGFGGFRIEMHFEEVDENANPQNPRNMIVEFGPGQTIDGIPGIGGPQNAFVDGVGEVPFPLQLTLSPSPGSPLGPLLNAIELYNWTPQPLTTITTLQGDVSALKKFLENFNITGYGQGDPCLPEGYPWTWVECNDDKPPRIKTINLANFNLSGSIPSSINNLTSLQRVDLSNNSLSGQIPNVTSLLDLEYLDLHNNKLSGELPSSLLSLRKLANLDVSNNNLCGSSLTFTPSTKFNHTGNIRLCSECKCISTPSSSSSSEKKSKRKYILAISFVGLLWIVSVLILLVACKASHKRAKERKSTSTIAIHKNGVGDFQGPSFMSRMFTYEEIKRATVNFSTILGQGGFGQVYHGLLPTGEEIAVKKLVDASKQGLKEFYNEVAILSKVRHKNLVSLIGYCVEDTYILVYEYIAKGNLRDLIYGDVKSADKPLSWKTRLHIALDASQGLEYLHLGCDPTIIHRDVKSTNILLSEKMQAKVADFGLSRLKEEDSTISHVSTVNVMGTAGYLDPAYNATNQLTDRSDVYSFGIVLFELICGRAPIDVFNSPPHIVEWAQQAILQGKVGDILDPMLENKYKMDSMWKVINTAIGCVQSDRVKRPKMSEVVQLLKNALEVEMDENNASNSQDFSGTSCTSHETFPIIQYHENI